ncbi:MAG: DNA-binding domain-containing protein [Shinella sp.]|nr:DNA-binding domain-containing protein [Shinella sp.]
MSATIIQTAFAAGLFTATPPPSGLVAWNAAVPERRYGVYRNNISASLAGALAFRFPAAESIVGPDFFRAMAREFIRAHPPRSPVLLAYGDAFPDFVAAFEPARELAYLPDVMRLEVARGRAYHAADARPLDPAALAAVEPARLGDLVLVPHPALSVLSSPHPVVTIWAMNAGERPLSLIDPWQGEHALVTRPHTTVEVIPLPQAGAAFFRRLAGGASLAEAAATAADGSFDLSETLAVLLRCGAFTAIKEDNRDEDRHHA